MYNDQNTVAMQSVKRFVETYVDSIQIQTLIRAECQDIADNSDTKKFSRTYRDYSHYVYVDYDGKEKITIQTYECTTHIRIYTR